jgi:hypothetical protein
MFNHHPTCVSGLGCTVHYLSESVQIEIGYPAGREIHVQHNLQAVFKSVSRSSDRQAAYATAARISKLALVRATSASNHRRGNGWF